MIDVVTVVGTRPQFIKAAAVMRALARHNVSQPENERLRHVLVNTGQHYDWGLSAISFEELGWPADARELSVGSAPHGAQTGRMLEGIEALLLEEQPGAVVVYGDTNSTVAGALAAAKLHIPVAHVEAGLRSFNRRMPEEINRVVTDHVSTWLFCPNDDAVRNLAAEGITRGVERTGDVMHELAMTFGSHAGAGAALDARSLRAGGYVLATIHRAENTDDPLRLRGILQALALIAAETPVIWPVHPRTRQAMAAAALGPSHAGLRMIDPVSYGEMLALERGAAVILTDSGGVQREACWFGVPCVTLRDETEWLDTVATGWNIVAGAASARIIEAYRVFTRDWQAPAPCPGPEPAADRVVAALARALTARGAAASA